MNDGIFFLAILISLAAAAIPAVIAERKGRSFGLWFFYGFMLFPIALIHAAVINPNENAPDKKKCSDCGGVIPKEAVVCAHCGTRFSSSPGTAPAQAAFRSEDLDWSGVVFDGDRSLSNPRYQTYLVKKYSIEKNDAMGKFIVDLDPFDDLPGALAFAHGVESVNTRRLQSMAPVAKERAAQAGNVQEAVEEVSTVISELDQAAINKLQHYEYKLMGIVSKGGAQIFKLRSTTNGSDFELVGSVKLREFAAQF